MRADLCLDQVTARLLVVLPRRLQRHHCHLLPADVCHTSGRSSFERTVSTRRPLPAIHGAVASQDYLELAIADVPGIQRHMRLRLEARCHLLQTLTVGSSSEHSPSDAKDETT